MLKIVLCCSTTISTSLLAEKMKTAAQKDNYQVDVYVSALNDIETIAQNANIVLMAPQVQYAIKYLKKNTCPHSCDRYFCQGLWFNEWRKCI